MFSWFKKKEKQASKRSFDAAKMNRLVASWLSVTSSINAELKEGIDALRARARDLELNEPMARRYLASVVANVIGARGVQLQARVAENGMQDKLANAAIEAAWNRFGRVGVFDISGRMSRNDFERAVIKCIARDGEALIIEHFGADNEFKYALQLVDVNLIATQKNFTLPNGNRVIMGVEIDKLGKPVAYHLHKSAFGDTSGTVRETERHSADNIIHLFLADSPEQVRGYSWMHASMIRMFHLKKYQEFALVASAVGASKMGFFVTPEGVGQPIADGEDEITGASYKEAAAGQFDVLPEGWDFRSFDPDYPHAMYGDFIKSAKRDIASGLNVSYNSLANDLEGVNFSSIRSGLLEEREQWMVYQDWFISCFEERVYANWMRSALLAKSIVLENGNALPATKREKFMAHEFLARRWPWVDPLKDEQAYNEAMKRGGASPYKIAAQKGEDAEDILDDIAKFLDYARAKNIPIELITNQNADTDSLGGVRDVE